MANYSTLKAAIQDAIKTNGNNEITGLLLQQSLIAMINSLGVGYEFMGLATISTNPGTPDQNVFYIAAEQGIYPNFNSLSVTNNEVAIFRYDGVWHKDQSGLAPASLAAIINSIVSPTVISTTEFNRTPSTSVNNITFPAFPMITGRKYHFKIEPNGYAVYEAQNYSFVLRATNTPSISGADDPNIVAVLLMMSRTDYTGDVIEFDYTAVADSEYLQIYIARASTAGSGVKITITESKFSIDTDKTLTLPDVPADAKTVGDIVLPFANMSNVFDYPTTVLKRIPSTSATTSEFPVFQMKAGRKYHFKIEPNGYTVYSSAYNYSFVIRATNTPSISGADDPNIVAVLLMMSRTDYTGDVIEFDYTAVADSEYLQLYVARAANPGTGVIYTITEQTYIIKVDKTLTLKDVPADAEAAGAEIRGNVGPNIYFGRKLDLFTHKYTLELLMSLNHTGNQGCDIANGLLFQAFDGGQCYVYDFDAENPTAIGAFNFACSSPDNHFNCINFGKDIPSGYAFPAVYISTGKANSPVDFVCHVEGITRSGNNFTSTLLQTITLDISGWAAVGYMPIWGAPHWLIDKERGYLWVFSAKLRSTQQYTGDFKNNKYIATQFNIPGLSGNVTLTANDILRQVIFDFDTYYTQGGTMKDGKIYYCFGLGNDVTNPTNIRVYDTDDGSVCTKFNMRTVLSYEPEDMIVYDDKLMVVVANGRLYRIY